MMRRLPAIAAAMLLLLPPLTTAGSGGAGSPDRVDTLALSGPRPANPVDGVLAEKVSAARPGERLDTVVRFDYLFDGKAGAGADLLKSNGIPVLRRFPSIHAYRVPALAGDIAFLSGLPVVRWMEYNEQMYPMMNATTEVINATKVWASGIIDRSGDPVDGRITGKGVTVSIVDTGVDAGHPDLDYRVKVISNLKSDLDGAYTEMENSDTGSGHGTHVAGTIAGNGDASGWGKRGVAPDARIVAVSTGEYLLTNVIGALEWTYENSHPNANPFNIRAVSNSWGSSGQYDPEDAVVKLIEKLTYENNVLVVFAAGNAGSDDHDGHAVTTNPYSLAPAAVSVAAFQRDYSGLASFSSRGKSDDNFTWPDIGAPGVKIWSSAARRTMISLETQKNDPDPYYLAISGTSMATPHISGLAALIWQACPNLKVSEVRDDYAGNDTAYWNSSLSRIHEIELILKLTARYVLPAGSGDNGVPANASKGLLNRSHDFAQGYGAVDSQRAVALALTLHELRKVKANATVFDAFRAYNRTIQTGWERAKTDSVRTSWKGEWSWLVGQNGSVLYTKARRGFRVDGNAEKVVLDLSYAPVRVDDGLIAGSLNLRVDTDGDGAYDSTTSGFSNMGRKHLELDAGGGETLWWADVEGRGFKLSRLELLSDYSKNQFREARFAYSISVEIRMKGGNTTKINLTDWSPEVGLLETGAATNASSEVWLERPYFNLTGVGKEKSVRIVVVVRQEFPWWLAAAVVVAVAVAAYYFSRKRGTDPTPTLP